MTHMSAHEAIERANLSADLRERWTWLMRFETPERFSGYSLDGLPAWVRLAAAEQLASDILAVEGLRTEDGTWCVQPCSAEKLARLSEAYEASEASPQASQPALSI